MILENDYEYYDYSDQLNYKKNKKLLKNLVFDKVNNNFNIRKNV